MNYKGKRTQPNNTPDLLSLYRDYRAGLSSGELILRRVLIILAALAVVLMLLALALASYVRPPELPSVDQPPVSSADPEQSQPPDEQLGDAPLLSVGQKEGVYSFLVCGRDTGGGGNTDTMLLVVFDTQGESIQVMSLPRDTMVNAKWRTKKLNTVYNYLGTDGLREHVGKLTGVTPNFYVLVEWEAVGELVEAIGGVEFDVPYNMDYDDPVQDLHIHQEKGLRRLGGEDAMQVIRWRKNNENSPYGSIAIGDSGRMELQQKFLMAVAKECLQLKNLVNLSRFATIFQENVETDLTFGNLLWFGQQALYLEPETDVEFCTLPANMNGSYNGKSYVFPYPEQVVELVNQRFNPYLRDVKESDLQIMVKNRDGSVSVTSGALADPSVATPPPATPSPSVPPEDPPAETAPPEGEDPPPAESEPPEETAPPVKGGTEETERSA